MTVNQQSLIWFAELRRPARGRQAGTGWSQRDSSGPGAADIAFTFGTAGALPVAWLQIAP